MLHVNQLPKRETNVLYTRYTFIFPTVFCGCFTIIHSVTLMQVLFFNIAPTEMCYYLFINAQSIG